MRKVLYGGYRSTDTATETVLERAYIPNDAHCWGKEYKDYATDGYNISDYTPYSQPTSGNRHLFASGSRIAPGNTNYAPLLRVKLNSSHRIWTWVSAENSNDIMGNSVVGTPDHDYHVRVKVAVPGLIDEKNEKKYIHSTSNAEVWKPIGLLQRFGESDRMFFGLMTGSYQNHLSGGVLRKNIGSITNEIDSDTGRFKYKYDNFVGGIIKTIDYFRIIGFTHRYDGSGNGYWDQTIYSRPINQGENYMWGNPVAEMMYEGLRYFAGENSPTSVFSSGISSGNDRGLDLPLESWNDPFDSDYYCSQPIMLVVTDINPSYDTDQLPGTAFGSFSGTFGNMNVQSLADTISEGEGIGGNHYIGESSGFYDTACSAKSVSGFGDIRGLCPEEPTKMGGYYSAAVAYYGRTNNISSNPNMERNVFTYSVALASPLPRIEIPISSGNKITMVPFAKTISSTGGGGVGPARGNFQPTSAIVDFYVEEISDTYGKFRVVYEHAEQGSDFDMDAIITYEYTTTSDSTIDVSLSSANVWGGESRQHFGYIISGTTMDGVYLEIKNASQTDAGDPDYYLDTPGTCGPNTGPEDICWNNGQPLPNEKTRSFTVNTSASAATLLNDPLWYAAKWGGFKDQNNNDIPDRQDEWDKKGDGVPDTYFYVNNPLQLEKELNRAFISILEKAASGTSASVLATTSRGEGNILQAYFRPTIPNNDDVKWLGYLQNLWVDSKGNIRENTSGKNVDESYSLDVFQDKILVFETDETGDTIVKKFAVNEDDPFPDIYTSKDYTTHNMNEILSIWEAGQKLLEKDASNRKIYTFIGDINDFPNAPQVFGESDSEVIVFNTTNMTSIRPYLGVLCNDDENCFYNYLGTNVTERAEKLIKFIRGEDVNGLRSRTIKDESNTEIGVWKLGDIINSSPAAVSRPPDNYHLIYGDKSYQDYYIANRNRETVVYVGANDGMLHAFTSWKYDSQSRKYTKPSGTTEDIGDEIWAYIPQSLLPHLKWLPDPDYSHVYYVDQMPLVADAKIGGTWRTLLIGGLRMGGKEIEVYEDFGNEIIENKTFYPTYFCIDITSPRNPKLLWERTYDNMGFSFIIPTIIREGEGSSDHWYLVFGSGPTDYDGKSDQKSRVFVVDLATGAPFGAGEKDFVFEGDDFAFFTSSTPMDKNLYVTDNKFSHEHVYLGQSYLYDNSWKGKIYRLDIKTSTPDTWDFNSVFSIDAPITASLALSVDKTANTWIFGGTGRYIEQADKTSTDDQYLFGFKDPLYNPGKDNFTKYDELSLSKLYRVDNLLVTTSKNILDSDAGNNQSLTTPTWNDLIGKTDVDYSNIGTPVYRDGWYRKLPKPGERCITKPSVIGGLSLMPSFVPIDDICGFGGESYFYSLYYKTGTAYYNPTFRNDGTYNLGIYDVVLDEISLGYGMPASHLGIHVGEQDGATALIQLGTGGIIKIDVDTAINIRSGILNWREK
jgi:type IV pilus assembly protein PilY1